MSTPAKSRIHQHRPMRFGLDLTIVGFLIGVGIGCAAGGGGGRGGPEPVNQDGGSGGDVGGVPGAADMDSDDEAGGNSGDMLDDGSDPEDAAGGGDADTPSIEASSAIVKTRIVIGSQGRIAAGDDLIVYGVADWDYGASEPAGVHFIVPSKTTSDTASGAMIPHSDVLFGIDDFVVAGRKVALVRSTNDVSIYDTETSRLVDIDVLLGANVISSERTMSADGAYIAAIANPAREFFGGKTIAVIDVSGPDPVVVNLPTPDDLFNSWQAVAIDADTGQVAAVGDLGAIYVYDLATPDALPSKFGVKGPTTSNLGLLEIRIDGGYVLYTDVTDIDARPALLDVSDGSVVRFEELFYFANYNTMALAGGRFGYFMMREDADLEEDGNNARSAIGRVAEAPSATLASQFDHYPLRSSGVKPASIQAECLDPKRIGYGRTSAISPRGDRWFLAGSGSVSEYYDYVQVSRGGAFSDIPDPEGDTFTGSLMGSDLACSGNILAFRSLRETDDGHCWTYVEQVVAFVRLDQFED